MDPPKECRNHGRFYTGDHRKLTGALNHRESLPKKSIPLWRSFAFHLKSRCESNYAVSSFIAEFVNTFSNVLFLVIPPLLIVLFQQYAKQAETRAIYVIWMLLIAVGLSSAYFHATLSFAGQMLDELAILWLICAGFSLWVPARYLSRFVKMNRYCFKWSMFAVTVVGTGLACLRPVVNAFALMAFGIPVSGTVYHSSPLCAMKNSNFCSNKILNALKMILLLYTPLTVVCSYSFAFQGCWSSKFDGEFDCERVNRLRAYEFLYIWYIYRCKEKKIRRLGVRTCVLFGLAVFCWLNDRYFLHSIYWSIDWLTRSFLIQHSVDWLIDWTLPSSLTF